MQQRGEGKKGIGVEEQAGWCDQGFAARSVLSWVRVGTIGWGSDILCFFDLQGSLVR